MKISDSKELKKLDNGNKFLGNSPELVNTIIEFNGKNNILYCDKNVKLVGTSIVFNGDNSIVFLSSNTHDYKLRLSLHHDNVFFMGKNNYMNNPLRVILSERKHCFIGNSCLFSTDIWIRNADPHLIYSAESMKRINPTKSVFIGDHVWIGQSALLLKGTQIDSGTIIGAMSVVSGKRIGSNSVWAGNPVREIKKDIFWNETCVHKWNKSWTNKSKNYSSFISGKNVPLDEFVYNYDKDQVIDYDELDKLFDSSDSKDLVEEFIKMKDSDAKNRFVHDSSKKRNVSRTKTLLRNGVVLKNKATRKVKKGVKKLIKR